MPVKRSDIINRIIASRGYSSYLEIGIQNGYCFNEILCKRKVGVDPAPNFKEGITVKTSDEFFSENTEKFDIVFIDGLHTYEQVKKDFHNAKSFLKPGGTIVMHDMNPTSPERAKSFSEGGQWNGDCYRLAIELRNSGHDFFTVNEDQGCLVYEGKECEKNSYEDSYRSFDENRNSILNLKTYEWFASRY